MKLKLSPIELLYISPNPSLSKFHDFLIAQYIQVGLPIYAWAI